jgi:SAM-dependent methyltransferase
MSDRHRRQWEALGRVDPYWAVISEPDKKGGRWNPEEFFASGANEIRDVLAQAAALGIEPARGLALDYGCGVGRLSRALAGEFAQVVGVDFSQSMLEEARRANAGIANLRFERNDGRSLPVIATGCVDFVYSVIALQHSPAQAQREIIREFGRVVAPGGVAVFQTPSRPNLGTVSGVAFRMLGNRLLNLPRRVLHGKDRVMEVHALPREEVVGLLGECGFDVREVERYDVAGPAFESYRYFAAKR